MIASLQSLVSRPERDCIYDILAHLGPGLCLDIGAAAGKETCKIARAGGPGTTVVAFEPFPGNHKFFADSTQHLGNRVRLIAKAVSDRIGKAQLTVPSTVHPGTPGWEQYVGYSSVGYLSNAGTPGPRSAVLSLLSRLRGRPQPQVLTVSTTTVDAEFPTEAIRFVKIDVQGAEALVLRGATEALAAKRIQVLYTEWSGDPVVVQTFMDHGYAIYDSSYVIGADRPDVRPFQDIGFVPVAELQLSTGRTAFEMLLPEGTVAPATAVAEVARRQLGWIQTDLIAVSPLARNEFATATRAYCAQRMPKTP